MVNTRAICIEAVPWIGHSRAPELIGAAATLMVLATISVILRFMARRISAVSYGPDDWLMLASLIFYVDSITFPLACSTLKFSILWFYGRIFVVRKFRICAVVGSIVRIPFFINLDLNDVSWSVVDSGIWLNVELAIGIISANIALMRPLFLRSFPSIRSRLSRSRTTGGSHRLHDANSINHSARIRTLENGGIYSGGGNKRHEKSWFGHAASSSGAGRTDLRDSEEESQEDMVPMGRIQVRHDVEWEQEHREGFSPPQ
ncbi:MAG: hypothetical protein Q9222_003011 [Ikaeria aurantiellina]